MTLHIEPIAHSTAAPAPQRKLNHSARQVEERKIRFASRPAPAPPAAPNKRTSNNSRRWHLSNVWHAAFKNVCLSDQQTKQLAKLYTKKATRTVPNMFSLRASLSSPTLQPNEAAIVAHSDAAHASGDCQCSIVGISNRPTLYTRAETISDPFSSE
jgi:hypothetical protein